MCFVLYYTSKLHGFSENFMQKTIKMIKLILFSAYLIALFFFVRDMCKGPLVKIDEDDIY